jgi:hypothetical protein
MKRRRFPEKVSDPERIFYLECYESSRPFVSNVWFVNNSEETLDYVRPSSGGFATSDDDVIHMSPNPNRVEFKDVKPGEAVLIDVYDRFFDGDFVISWGVELKSPSLGERRFSSGATKGSTPEMGLFWKPLPEEIKNPDDPEKLVDPAKVAEAYRRRSGMGLPANIYLNKGNLLYGDNLEVLDICGLQSVTTKLQDGHVTDYRFLDGNGDDVFRTLDLGRAIAFVRGLKAP